MRAVIEVEKVTLAASVRYMTASVMSLTLAGQAIDDRLS
jgi:hypothetical protein